MLIEACLDYIRYTKKPEKNTIIEIQNRIAFYPVTMDIKELAEEISKGKSFCPSIFAPKKRCKKNFLKTQLFALDFDDGYVYEDILSKFHEYKIPVCFSYHSLRSMPICPKFRIVICHIVPITEVWLADMILLMLKKMFPEADPLCFECSRMFLGGKELIECNENAMFRVDYLIDVFQAYEYKSNPHNCTRDIRAISKACGVCLNGSLLDIRTYENNVTSPKMNYVEENRFKDDSIYILSLNQFSSDSYPIVFFNRGRDLEKKGQGKNIEPTMIQHVGADTLYNTCRLFKIFYDNDEDLSHEEHFLLALNLIYIKGFKDIFFGCLKRAGSDIEKWKYDWIKIKQYGYQPKSCNESCRFAHECDHKKNILLTLQSRSSIKLIRKTDYVTAEESFELMVKILEKELSDRTPEKIALIQAQTGLGKTSAYLEALTKINEPVVIAVPTVELKHDIAQRAGDNLNELVSLKDLLLPEDILFSIQNLYDSGHYREAREMIRQFGSGLPEDDIHKERKDRINRYLNVIEVLSEKRINLIMTHAQLMNFNEEQLEGYTVIVDEDILYTMMRNVHTVDIKSVLNAISAHLFPEEFANEIKNLIESEEGTYVRIENINRNESYISMKEQKEAGSYGDINDLLKAGAVCKKDNKIHYYTPQKLPAVKTIVLSATLSKPLYDLFFPKRMIEYYRIPPAMYRGRLIQYTYHTMSRSEINHLIDLYGSYNAIENRLLGLIADKIDYEIGFKRFMNDFCLSAKMNYGATAGIDRYKGKNGLIIGTPHLEEKSYKLITCFLNVDVQSERLSNRRITYKDYSFNMMTYENDILRELQLYFIESELEQSIGRSRLLREDCSVYLFSNFPCEQAQLIADEYLEKDENKADMPIKDIPA